MVFQSVTVQLTCVLYAYLRDFTFFLDFSVYACSVVFEKSVSRQGT